MLHHIFSTHTAPAKKNTSIIPYNALDNRGHYPAIRHTSVPDHTIQKACVAIMYNGSLCASGILVHPYYIITARHVLDDKKARNFSITLHSDKHVTQSIRIRGIVEDNPLLDYVLLLLEEPVTTLQPISWSVSTPMEQVFFIHHLHDGTQHISCHRIISSQHTSLTMNSFHTTDLGSSGGIYVDEKMHIVALHTQGKRRNMQGEIADTSYTTRAIWMKDIYQSSTHIKALYRKSSHSIQPHDTSTKSPAPYHVLAPIQRSRLYAHFGPEEVFIEKAKHFPNITPFLKASLDPQRTTSKLLHCTAYSYHHIIGKGAMNYLWIIAQEYSPLSTMLSSLSWPYNSDNPHAIFTIEDWTWAPWNLFIGPNTENRKEQPGGYDIEKKRPLSFPAALWDNITILWQCICQAALARPSTSQGLTTHNIKHNMQNIVNSYSQNIHSPQTAPFFINVSSYQSYQIVLDNLVLHVKKMFCLPSFDANIANYDKKHHVTLQRIVQHRLIIMSEDSDWNVVSHKRSGKVAYTLK